MIKNNNKIMKGGKYKGSGTYGCIFGPNTPCESAPYNTRDDKLVSKIINKTDTQTEFSNLHVDFEIQKIDPNSEYVIYPFHNCKIGDITADDLEVSDEILKDNPYHIGCKKNQEHMTNYIDDDIKSGDTSYKKAAIEELNKTKTQLIMLDGGRDMDNTRYDKSIQRPNINEIWESHLHLIKGLVLLNKNGIGHRDIKPPNIVIKDNKMRFIDLGLSKSIDGPWWVDYENTPYLYWPADYILASHNRVSRYFNINDSDNDLDKKVKIIRGVMTNVNKYPYKQVQSPFHIYTSYAIRDTWLLDDDHLKNMIKTIIQFLIDFRVYNKYTEGEVQDRIKNTLDTFSVGTVLSKELQILKNTNQSYADEFREIVIKATSLNPFDRPHPRDLFRMFVKMVRKHILKPGEEHLLEPHIDEINRLYT